MQQEGGADDLHGDDWEERLGDACTADGSSLAAFERRECQDITRLQASIDQRRADMDMLGKIRRRVLRVAPGLKRRQQATRQRESKHADDMVELRSKLGNAQTSAAEVSSALEAALADVQQRDERIAGLEAKNGRLVAQAAAGSAAGPSSAAQVLACRIVPTVRSCNRSEYHAARGGHAA